MGQNLQVGRLPTRVARVGVRVALELGDAAAGAATGAASHAGEWIRWYDDEESERLGVVAPSAAARGASPDSDHELRTVAGPRSDESPLPAAAA